METHPTNGMDHERSSDERWDSNPTQLGLDNSPARCGVVVWCTGLPSSGKSSFAERAKARLGEACCILDGDRLRQLIHPSPGYGAQARDDFYGTLGELAAELARQGLVVIVAATANRRVYRERARAHAPHFIEVWLDSNVDECRARDAKGLYARLARGEIEGLPGEDAVYEAPESPDVHARGAHDEVALDQLIRRLEQRNHRPPQISRANAV